MEESIDATWVRHLSVYYIISYTREKLVIYGKENLDDIQEIRNFSSDIYTVVPSEKNGYFLVLCEKEVNIFMPCFNPLGHIEWKKVYRNYVDDDFTVADFSNASSAYLICSSQKNLALWKINYLSGYKEVLGVSSLEELFKFEINESISRLMFSPDDRFFASQTKNSNNLIVVWDFHKFLEKRPAFQDDHNTGSNITNFTLKHKHPVRFFSFRESSKESKSINRCPNTIATFDETNCIRIWQENIFKEELFFFHSSTLSLDNLKSPISMIWVTFSKKFNGAEEEGENKQQQKYGTYEKDLTSVDWITVADESSLDLVEVSHLRNHGNTSNIRLIKSNKHQSIIDFTSELKNVVFQIYSKKKNCLEVIGINKKQGIIKVDHNLQEEITGHVINSSKKYVGKILLANLNREENTFAVLNDRKQLIFYTPQTSFNFSEDYSRIGYSITCRIPNEIEEKYSYIFHSKNIILLVNSYFTSILVIPLADQTSIYTGTPSEFPTAPKFFPRFFTNKQALKSIRCLEMKNDANKTDFTFVCGQGRENVYFKMTIFADKLINGNLDEEKKPLKIPDSSLSFEDVFTFEVDTELKFSNFKIYDYSPENQSFDYCGLDKKVIEYFHVSKGYVEKRKEFIFKHEIKHFEKAACCPPIFFFVDINNEIDFYSEKGEFLTRFMLLPLFSNIDKSLIDITHFNLLFEHIYDHHFLMGIENYLTIVSLNFDTRKQSYVVSFLFQSENSKEIYYKRFSKKTNPKSYKLFVGRNKSFFVKTEESIKSVSATFEYEVINPVQKNFFPDNIHTKLFKTHSILPHHDPEFIYELLSMGKYTLVECIFREMIKSLKAKGYISSKFAVDFEKICKYSQNSQAPDYDSLDEKDHLLYSSSRISHRRASFVKAQEREVVVLNIDEEKEDPLRKLHEALNTYSRSISLPPSKVLLLCALIEFVIEYKENKRSLDDYAAIFLVNVKVLKILQIQASSGSKKKSMLTKEVVWALHSQQKDTLIQECVEKTIKSQEEGAGELTWDLLKKYSVVIWNDNLDKMKQFVEIIAKNDYKKSQDAFTVCLWYIMLGKKTILTTLFKKDREQQKTYEFLMNDFREPRWKSAASKNGYALLAKKRYEVSAAFFLLGGHINEALNIIITNIQDIQLALLVCKLVETDREKPIFNKLIKEHFIDSGRQTKDLWLTHIGYILLNQHVNALNCLYEFGNESTQSETMEELEGFQKSCLSWPPKFTPLLSSFHPSALILAQKLKDSIPVKREIQNSQQQAMAQVDIFDSFWGDEDTSEKKTEQKEVLSIKENIQKHLESSLEYYLSVNNPTAGLMFFVTHKDSVVPNKSEEINSMGSKLLGKYLEFLLEDSIVEDDWENYYTFLQKKIEAIIKFLPFEEDEAVKYCIDKIRPLRSPKIYISYLLSANKEQIAYDVMIKYVFQIERLYLYHIKGSFFTFQPRYFWVNMAYACEELISSANLLRGKETKKELKSKNDSFLSKVEFLFFFGIFSIGVSLCSWEITLKIIDECSGYVKDIQINEGIHKKNIDLAAFFESVKSSTEQHPNLKLKNEKSTKFIDIISQAFPRNPYQKVQSGKYEKDTFNLEEQKNKPEKILTAVMRYLLAEYFNRLFIKQLESNPIFKGESESYKGISSASYEEGQLSLKNLIYFMISFEHKLFKTYKYLSKQMNPLENIKILEEIKGLFQGRFPDSMKYIKSPEEVIDLNLLKEMGKKINFEKGLENLLVKACDNLYKSPNIVWSDQFEQEKLSYFKTGFELVKIKGETIKGIGLNNYQGGNTEAVILTNKGFKKVNLLYQLMNRTRANDGYSLIEEESVFSEDVNIKSLYDKDLLSSKHFMTKICHSLMINDKTRIKGDPQFRLRENKYSYQINFNDSDVEEMIASSNSRSFLSTEFNDFTNIVSHPSLPVFLTGGARGIVNLWSYSTLGNLGDFVTTSKDSVSNIKFNNFGDKFGGVDLSGNLYLWKMNKLVKSFKPIYTLMASNKKSASDFCFISDSSVLATVSLQPKPTFSIWDTLLPSNSNLIMSDNYGGSEIFYSSRKGLLIMVNAKKAGFGFFDLRKRQLIKQFEMPNLEAKSVLLNKSENALVVGTSDEAVKIIDLDRFETVAEIKPFKSDPKKKSAISHLVQIENSIIAANTEGCVSLAYPSLL